MDGRRRLTLRPNEAAGVAAIALLGAGLLARTWMTWVNPTVDSSRELMIPARVALGERLYLDVVAHYGPVPVWLHAAADRLFGLQLSTPLALLLPLAAITIFSFHVLVRRVAGPLAACCASLLATAVALVAPNGGALVFPYSFSAAHGLAFSSLALALFQRPSRAAAAGAAGLWGLALASKPELALVGLTAALAGEAFGSPGPWRFPRRAFVTVIAAVACGLGIWGVALRGIPLRSLVLEGPLVLFHLPREWRGVYEIVSGLGDPSRAIAATATGAFLALLLLAAVQAGAGFSRRAGTGTALSAFGGVAALVVAGLLATDSGRVLDQALPPALRAAPLALAGIVALLAARRIAPSPAHVALAVAGSLGAVRVALNFTYGWSATPYAALAAPGLVAAAVAAAFVLLPGRGPFLAASFVSLAALQAGRIVLATDPSTYVTLETPRGALRLGSDRAEAFGGAMSWISARARPGDTLAAFPEAGLLNFALGLPNPLRQDQILPGHLDAAAEEATVARLRERRPRFVVLANQPSAAFGPESFGRDYATSLWAAVLDGWRLAATFGAAWPADPVGSGPFFIRVYERNDDSREAPPAARK
ncbi:MAG: hypothetical protein IPP07_15310 [Holophagales bacterium]|nr:hypothetical protein [Holophagales bacterium]